MTPQISRAYYRAGTYRPYEAIVREAAVESGTPEGCADALIQRWVELQPWSEVPEVLSELGRRVPLAIVTNCSEALGQVAASRAGRHFKAVITAESVGFYKPRPEPYRAALSALGAQPSRTLFVAGSAADVPGAKGEGMTVFWHNRLNLKQVDEVQPDHTAASLWPLLELV